MHPGPSFRGSLSSGPTGSLRRAPGGDGRGSGARVVARPYDLYDHEEVIAVTNEK